MYTCCITTSLFYCVFIVNVFADVATAEIMELSCQDVKFKKNLTKMGICMERYIFTYTLSKKRDPFSFEHNFCKYCPILIILSLLQTEIICPQTDMYN